VGFIIYKTNTKYVPPLYILLYPKGALICALSFLCYTCNMNILDSLQDDNPIADFFLIENDFQQICVTIQDSTDYDAIISVILLEHLEVASYGRLPIIHLIKNI